MHSVKSTQVITAEKKKSKKEGIYVVREAIARIRDEERTAEKKLTG